jgi:DNA-binding NtrC family response regulator
MLLSKVISDKGYRVLSASRGTEALGLAEKEELDVALVDIHLGDMDGLQLLERLRAQDPDIGVIILTGDTDIPTAVRAIKMGAIDYLTKPCRNDEILLAVEKAVHEKRLHREVQVLRETLTRAEPGAEVVAAGPAMKRVLDEAARIAKTDLTVILQGGSGTGKELIARELHRRSGREGAFIAVDCGALPEPLAESELFGHEKGAFTGADGRKLGLFELAMRGTVFLDEISNLSYAMQAKFLRVLQEKRLRRVGGQKDLEFDARVIAASNLDLEDLVRQKKFREDLYHRLAQFTIRLPDLRERPEDIPALADRFLQDANIQLRKHIQGIKPAAMKQLQGHSWPGNVRELKNVITQAAIVADGEIEPEHLRLPAAVHAPKGSFRRVSRQGADAAEKRMIQDALKKSDGNKVRAARMLGINRMTLYLKLKKYKL